MILRKLQRVGKIESQRACRAGVVEAETRLERMLPRTAGRFVRAQARYWSVRARAYQAEGRRLSSPAPTRGVVLALRIVVDGDVVGADVARPAVAVAGADTAGAGAGAGVVGGGDHEMSGEIEVEAAAVAGA